MSELWYEAGDGATGGTMAETKQILLFPPFHLDLVNERLWRAEQAVALRPKDFAVLRIEGDLRLVYRRI
jgi:DNA-binding response OmpR family regulator